MKKVAIILANGFEMVEALAPIDYLKRAGVSIDVIGLATQTPVSSHGITVTADIIHTRASINDYDAVILPGGMPGAKNLDESDFVRDILASVNKKGGILAAICAAPMVLGHRNLLMGKRATCFPGFEGELYGAIKLEENVVTDGNVTTASGMPAAMDFAKELTAILVSHDAVKKIFG